MELQIFQSKEFQIRGGVDDNGKPYLIAKDVCDCLGLGNVTRAVAELDNDELTLLKVRADNQIREMNVIYESGFYAFVFKSRKPEAKKFRKWVTSEVLPTIRKHGVYASPQNFTMNAIVSMAQNFIGLEQEVKEIKADVQSLQDTSAFTSNDCRLYLNAVNAKVDGIISQYPDNPRSSIYPQIHNAVKERYQVGSYKDLPHYKIDEVIDFVKTLSIRVRIAK